MFKSLPVRLGRVLLHTNNTKCNNYTVLRSFLSNAYYCQEVWDARLKSPLLQKVNLDEFYHDLDLSYQKNNNISAVDVDIFSNAAQSDCHIDELLDVVHKLRISSDSMNTLESTHHAIVRYLISHEKYDQLFQVLEDRLNYGIFLDSYTCNLLLDIFWKKKDYASGARVSSQVMLQEDFNHPLTTYLSLLHCYNFVQNPIGWSETPTPEEPEDEVKIRVKYIRNPYFDDHFDLRDPIKIVGKTMTMASTNISGLLGNTFQVLGLALHGNEVKFKQIINKLSNSHSAIISDILKYIPDDNPRKVELQKLKMEEADIQSLLETNVCEQEKICSEGDIAEQCKIFEQWEQDRTKALKKQQERLEVAQRLTDIENSQKLLKEKEMKLWFFEKEEQLELDIEAKKVFYPKRWFGKKKKPRKIDEGYVPPEIKTSYQKKQ